MIDFLVGGLFGVVVTAVVLYLMARHADRKTREQQMRERSK